MVRYGALCDVEKQLNEIGYTLGGKKELVDKMHFGLNICHIHGVLTDAQYRKALERLNKKVGEFAVKMEGHDESEQ